MLTRLSSKIFSFALSCLFTNLHFLQQSIGVVTAGVLFSKSVSTNRLIRSIRVIINSNTLRID